MAPDWLHLLNLVLAGSLFGNELGTLIVLHPSARVLPLPERVRFEQAVTRRYGALMPFWMVGTLTSGVALSMTIASAGRALAIGGTACLAAMLAVTLAGNMPVNFFTLRAGEDVDPDEWRRRRRRWDAAHAVRVILDGVALACFVLALLAVVR